MTFEFPSGPRWEKVEETYQCVECGYEQSFTRYANLAQLVGPFNELDCMRCERKTPQSKIV